MEKILLILIFFTNILYAQPNWISNPISNSKYISAVGFSSEENPQLRERLAITIARANLAESIKVNISTEIEIINETKNGNTTKESVKQTISQKANELLKKSYVKDKYIDNNGVLYILIAIDNDKKGIK